MTEKNNVGLICADCSNERYIEWQKKNKYTKITVGDYVKLCFTQGDRREHMWVKVTQAEYLVNEQFTKINGKFKGKLDNDPRLVRTVKCGDEVTFIHADIEDHTT